MATIEPDDQIQEIRWKRGDRVTLRALVTNDDGVDSEGLRLLAIAAVQSGFDVTVAAPLRDSSGSSAALRAMQSDGKVVIEPRTLEGLEEVPVHGVAAAPAFIVLIARRGAFGDPPDIVLSGINRGANTGNAILHSGTVGAALTGGSEGSHGLAVSIAGGEPVHWQTAAAVARTLMPGLAGLPRAVVLNVNVPDLPLAELRGLRTARLARFGVVQTKVKEVGKGYVKLGIAERDGELEPGTDSALIRDGYAAITALTPICERADVDLSWLPSSFDGVAAAGDRRL